jgi:hypothetical protein
MLMTLRPDTQRWVDPRFPTRLELQRQRRLTALQRP